MSGNWKYFNHMAIPVAKPWVPGYVPPVLDSGVWCLDGKKPFLAKWETDWDCAQNTGWWYVIKDAPFDMEKLGKSARKNIRRALRNNVVERLDPVACFPELWECRHQAFAKYKLADEDWGEEDFRKWCAKASQNAEFWGGRDAETGKLIGFMSIRQVDDWAIIGMAKFDPRYLGLRVSDALYATVLSHYLNERGCAFISSGTRNINHVTNTQAYKEEHFGYRKAYCRLHIVYAPRIRWLMCLLYPFRRLVWRLGAHNKKFHLLGAVLKMDEIARGDEKCVAEDSPNEDAGHAASSGGSDV